MAYKLLTMGNSAIVVTDGSKSLGVVTRQDVIAFLSSHAST